jgi:hypothetical protein
VLDDNLFTKLMTILIEELKTSMTPGTYIQSISIVCCSAGVKIGTFLPQIVPKLEELCAINFTAAGGCSREENAEGDDAQMELWEQSLQALEAITLRCPSKITAYVPKIVQLAMQLSMYDPLYQYDDAHASATKSADEDDGEWGDDGGDDVAMADDGAWGNDNDGVSAAVAMASSDNSWKVRRAAVCLLTAFIRVRSDILKDYYSAVCDHLVSRFKERDTAVKEEILLCMRDLLHESVVNGKSAGHIMHTGRNDAMEDDTPSIMEPTFLQTRSSYETLDVKLPESVLQTHHIFFSLNMCSRLIFVMVCV